MKSQRLRVEKYRETIGGIEVVDAAFADRLLTAFDQVASARSMFHGTKATMFNAKLLFGKDSEEFRLWQEKHHEDWSAYRYAWGNAITTMDEASSAKA